LGDLIADFSEADAFVIIGRFAAVLVRLPIIE